MGPVEPYPSDVVSGWLVAVSQPASFERAHAQARPRREVREGQRPFGVLLDEAVPRR
jgi:hypothetical protein